MTRDTIEDATDWQPVSLGGEVEPSLYIEVALRGGRERVGLIESIPFERVTSILTEIAQGVEGALTQALPKKASVELGVEFGLQEGKLTALIARGTAKANLKITLEWERSAEQSKT